LKGKIKTVNTDYFLYLTKEKRNQIINLKTRKQNLIREKEKINIELKKLKCFNWLWFKRVIIKIITFGCINKNKKRNFNIKKLTKEVETLNRSINSTNLKIEKIENRLKVLKINYLKEQTLKINSTNLQNQPSTSEYKSQSLKM